MCADIGEVDSMDWLLKIGEGLHSTDNNQRIELPANIVSTGDLERTFSIRVSTPEIV